MRILVTGAGGFVGRHLVASLRRDGKSVIALDRGGAASGDPARFAAPADLAAIETAPGWPPGLDAVVHLGARNPGLGDRPSLEALHHANVAGTAALVRRARLEGVARIVFASTSNLHAAGPDPIRETDPLRPESLYARSKAAAETAFWSELAGSDTQGCVLRPAPVYGRGGRGTFAALARLARSSLPLPIEGIGGPRSLLAVDHLTDVIALCMTAEGAGGDTFLVADDEPLTPAGIVRALRRGRSRPERVFAPPLALPSGVLARLRDHGALGTFVLDTRHLAARTGWHPGRTAAERITSMAAAGDL